MVPKYKFSDEKLHTLRRAASDLISHYPHIPTEGLVSPHIFYMGFDRPDIHDAFLDICKMPELLDIVEQLIGPDIIIWGSGIFSKGPKTGRSTPWHQDGEYWPIRPLATATLWIAIDDCNEENGCLKILLGSHKDKILLPHESIAGSGGALDKEIHRDNLDEKNIISVPLEAGEVVIFDVFTGHGASPNFSNRRRACFAIRYMPGTSLYDHNMNVGSGQDDVQTDLSKRALFLVRGEDKTGRNNFSIGQEGMLVEVTP